MNRLEQKLKNNNLKLTAPRKVVFDILNESQIALSPKDVCDRILSSKKLKADQASIYRNLTLFSEIGLVHRFDSGKYSVCQHENHDGHKHIHIIANCLSCGKTYEVESHSPELCDISKEFKSHLKDFTSFSGITLQGKCLSCSNK